jgi:hypothetical protein
MRTAGSGTARVDDGQASAPTRTASFAVVTAFAVRKTFSEDPDLRGEVRAFRMSGGSSR